MGAQVAHVPPRSLTRPTRPSYDHQHNVLLPRARGHIPFHSNTRADKEIGKRWYDSFLLTITTPHRDQARRAAPPRTPSLYTKTGDAPGSRQQHKPTTRPATSQRSGASHTPSSIKHGNTSGDQHARHENNFPVAAARTQCERPHTQNKSRDARENRQVAHLLIRAVLLTHAPIRLILMTCAHALITSSSVNP